MLPVWLLLLHVTHVEPFEWPPPDAARGYALVAAMMGAYQVPARLYSPDSALPTPPTALRAARRVMGRRVWQVLLFAAIAITSPTFVAVGQLLVPPLSMAYDFLFSGYGPPAHPPSQAL